jgi:hypothetical protein
MIGYEQFPTDWKDADPDTPELIDAKKRMAVLGGTRRNECKETPPFLDLSRGGRRLLRECSRATLCYRDF